MNKTLTSIIILIGGFFLFTAGLTHQEIIGFESRFYVFAEEMLQTGWRFFPTTYFVPYPDYPATATVLMVLSAKLFGGLTKSTAIFPSAFASALTLVVTYHIGALRDARWGWFAVLFLLLTNTFVMEARTISLDQYVTLFTALCFYLVYSAQMMQCGKRLLWLPLLGLLGFAFRGPLGLIIPAAVVITFYLLEKEYKKLLYTIVISGMVLLIGCALLTIMAYHTGGMDFVHAVLRMQVGSRLHDARAIPWYFYWKEGWVGYAISFPIAMIFVVLMNKKLFTATTANMHLLQKLLGWVLIILIGLSIPADKKLRYILPIAPAIALMSSYLVFVTCEHILLFRFRQMIVGVLMLLPLLTIILLSVVQEKLMLYGIITINEAIMLLIALQLIVLWYRRSLTVILISAIAVMFFVIFTMIEPITQQLNATRDFVERIEKIRLQKKAALVFYRLEHDGLPIKYKIYIAGPTVPRFVNNIDQIRSNEFIITSEEYFQKLNAKKYHIVLRGNIGREPVIVFKKI